MGIPIPMLFYFYIRNVLYIKCSSGIEIQSKILIPIPKKYFAEQN